MRMGGRTAEIQRSFFHTRVPLLISEKGSRKGSWLPYKNCTHVHSTDALDLPILPI